MAWILDRAWHGSDLGQITIPQLSPSIWCSPFTFLFSGSIHRINSPCLTDGFNVYLVRFWIHSPAHVSLGLCLTVLTILVYYVLAPKPRPATPASQTSSKGSKKKTPTKSSKISPQASTSQGVVIGQSSTESGKKISKKCGTKLSQLSASPARFVIQSRSKNRTFEYRKHSKTGHFWLPVFECSVSLDHLCYSSMTYNL